MAPKGAKTGGTVIDLFSGCGGFSLGAESAGFRSLVAVDIDPTLQSAFRRNFPGSHAIEGDLSEIDGTAWGQFIGKVRPDGVIGGPPCQGFSRIGRRRKDDPRNSLIHHFCRHVAALKPKFFIMENVEGLLDDDRITVLTHALETLAAKYRVLSPFMVNAADFGAATNRYRVVIIGYDPEEVDPLIVPMFQPKPPTHPATVRQAISDLPTPVPESKDEEASFGWAKYPSGDSAKLSKYARRLRMPPVSGLGWSKAIGMHRDGFISGLTSTRHSHAVASRYARIASGKSDPITKSYRLDWDGQCPTLRAGTDRDKGAFQAVRPLHPGNGRVITIREAARLQGFPDWFVFHPTKWHSFRMIGNSVSPAVSRGILAAIATKMQTSALVK